MSDGVKNAQTKNRSVLRERLSAAVGGRLRPSLLGVKKTLRGGRKGRQKGWTEKGRREKTAVQGERIMGASQKMGSSGTRIPR